MSIVDLFARHLNPAGKDTLRIGPRRKMLYRSSLFMLCLKGIFAHAGNIRCPVSRNPQFNAAGGDSLTGLPGADALR
jgi:hypothetical protein